MRRRSHSVGKCFRRFSVTKMSPCPAQPRTPHWCGGQQQRLWRDHIEGRVASATAAFNDGSPPDAGFPVSTPAADFRLVNGPQPLDIPMNPRRIWILFFQLFIKSYKNRARLS